MSKYAEMVQRLKTPLRKPREVDEGKLARQMELGNAAADLDRNEYFQMALAEIEETYMRAWRGSDALDVEMRERIHVTMCVIGDLRNLIISHVRDGAAAREKLERALHR